MFHKYIYGWSKKGQQHICYYLGYKMIIGLESLFNMYDLFIIVCGIFFKCRVSLFLPKKLIMMITFHNCVSVHIFIGTTANNHNASDFRLQIFHQKTSDLFYIVYRRRFKQGFFLFLTSKETLFHNFVSYIYIPLQ